HVERSRLPRRRFDAKAGGIFRIRWPHPDGNHGFNVERSTPSVRESAGGGARTHTALRPLDFESSASANSATPAFGKSETTDSNVKLKRSRFPACHAFEKSCLIRPDGDAFTIEKG